MSVRTKSGGASDSDSSDVSSAGVGAGGTGLFTFNGERGSGEEARRGDGAGSGSDGGGRATGERAFGVSEISADGVGPADEGGAVAAPAEASDDVPSSESSTTNGSGTSGSSAGGLSGGAGASIAAIGSGSAGAIAMGATTVGAGAASTTPSAGLSTMGGKESAAGSSSWPVDDTSLSAVERESSDGVAADEPVDVLSLRRKREATEPVLATVSLLIVRVRWCRGEERGDAARREAKYESEASSSASAEAGAAGGLPGDGVRWRCSLLLDTRRTTCRTKLFTRSRRGGLGDALGVRGSSDGLRVGVVMLGVLVVAIVGLAVWLRLGAAGMEAGGGRRDGLWPPAAWSAGFIFGPGGNQASCLPPTLHASGACLARGPGPPRAVPPQPPAASTLADARPSVRPRQAWETRDRAPGPEHARKAPLTISAANRCTD